MGREIRRVPKGWVHPSEPLRADQMDGFYHRHHKPGSFGYGLNFHALYDQDYESAVKEWKDGYVAWESGTDPDRAKHPEYEFWEWDSNPPDREYYREKFTEEPTCYQMYETVSEGTPVSPVFETIPELIEWMVGEGYSREAATAFCASGWAPSFVYTPNTGLIDGVEASTLLD